MLKFGFFSAIQCGQWPQARGTWLLNLEGGYGGGSEAAAVQGGLGRLGEGQ